MGVFPNNSRLPLYQWRYNLQNGSTVDFQDSRTSSWVLATVKEVRVQPLDPEGQYVDLEL